MPKFGDFGGLSSAASLDYLQNLGVTMIYLQPIFPSNAYHGYQHGPGDQLSSRFGTQAQLQTLIDAAHARGIKIILDYVAYGISHTSTYYSSVSQQPRQHIRLLARVYKLAKHAIHRQCVQLVERQQCRIHPLESRNTQRSNHCHQLGRQMARSQQRWQHK